MEKSVEKELENTLKVFAPISLQQLNASVSFLERIDTKYLVNVKDLPKIVEELEKDYYVLNIKDVRIFDYDNVYMDSKNLDFYYAHERGDDVRVKVRTRNYVDSNLCFFEYKHKEGNLIRKFRYQEDTNLFGVMDDNATRFFNSIYGSLMEGATKLEIAPTIKTRYKRFTLCSKYSDERITIDLDLTFSDPNNTGAKPIEIPHLAIIESKATSEKSRSAKIMKKFGIKKVGGCSKYCLGLIYFKKVTSQKKFKNTLKTIEKLGGKSSLSRAEKKQKKTLALSKTSMNELKKVVSTTEGKGALQVETTTKKPTTKTAGKTTARPATKTQAKNMTK